jgi:hypothetical protein
MPTQTRINREKYTFCVIKSLEHLINLKTGRRPHLGLELTSDHACHQKPNPSRATVPFIDTSAARPPKGSVGVISGFGIIYSGSGPFLPIHFEFGSVSGSGV